MTGVTSWHEQDAVAEPIRFEGEDRTVRQQFIAQADLQAFLFDDSKVEQAALPAETEFAIGSGLCHPLLQCDACLELP